MTTNLLNRIVFVLACVMGLLVTTAQSLVIEHPSLQNLSTITTDFRVSEDDVPSLQDFDERRLLKVNEEELAHDTTGHGIQKSLFRSFRTDSRLGITKVLHRMQRGTSQKERQRHIDIKVNSVVSKIKNGHLVEAKQKFVELGDDKLLARIVKDTYASDITHVDNIIWFARKLKFIKQCEIAYRTLLAEMKLNLHLETPQLILLDHFVKESMKQNHYQDQTKETKNKFNLLKRELLEPVQNIMRIVLTGSTERVKAFAQQKYDTNYLIQYIQNIVSLLYANGNDNTLQILSFVRKLHKTQEYAIGYEAVYKEMQKKNYWTKDGGTLFTFGVKIKESMEMPNYSKIDQKYKNILETLKLNLPATVRHILWDNVFIKNKKYNDYIYAGSDIISGVRQIFTWGGSGGKRSLLDTGKWKFQSVNNANNFRIYNPHYNEYLKLCVPMRTGLDYFPWPCMPFNKTCDSDSEWELLLVDRNKSIVIKNKSTGQFVFAATYIVDYNRNIVLIAPDSVMPYDDQFIWQVEK